MTESRRAPAVIEIAHREIEAERTHREALHAGRALLTAGQTEINKRHAGELIDKLEEMFSGGRISSQEGGVLTSIPHEYINDEVKGLIHKYLGREWIAQWIENTGSFDAEELYDSLEIKPDLLHRRSSV